MQRIIYEIYRDRGAFLSHERQPHIRQFAADRASCVLATNIIDLRLKYAKVAALGSAPEAGGAAAGELDAARRRSRAGQRPLRGDNAVLAGPVLVRPSTRSRQLSTRRPSTHRHRRRAQGRRRASRRRRTGTERTIASSRRSAAKRTPRPPSTITPVMGRMGRVTVSMGRLTATATRVPPGTRMAAVTQATAIRAPMATKAPTVTRATMATPVQTDTRAPTATQVPMVTRTAAVTRVPMVTRTAAVTPVPPATPAAMGTARPAGTARAVRRSYGASAGAQYTPRYRELTSGSQPDADAGGYAGQREPLRGRRQAVR